MVTANVVADGAAPDMRLTVNMTSRLVTVTVNADEDDWAS